MAGNPGDNLSDLMERAMSQIMANRYILSRNQKIKKEASKPSSN